MKKTLGLLLILLVTLPFLFSGCGGGGGGGTSTTGTGTETTDIVMISTADPLQHDFTNKVVAFEPDVEAEWSNSPSGTLFYLGQGESDPEKNLRDNLDLYVTKGIEWLYLHLLDGQGVLWFSSSTLLGLTHSGVDYNAQYVNSDTSEELAIAESDAKKRYVLVYDAAPLVVQEAHSRGLKVALNIESLAHIINKSTGAGIGGSATEVSIADNLPAPTLSEFNAFVQEVIALEPDAVFAEAYSPTYDNELSTLLSQASIPYWRGGSKLGDVWMGYYYSPYPTVAGDYRAYEYLITADGQLAMHNGDIYARARAWSTSVKTALVVGAYNPFPCDLTLNLYDLYSESRTEEWINGEYPTLATDESFVQNCTTNFWRNLILHGVLTQEPDMVILSADMDPSIQAALDLDLSTTIKSRIAEHTYTPSSLPVANIILDTPQFGSDDSDDNESYFELVAMSILPNVSDGLEAAGLQVVLTEDTPWTGGTVALTYIITAGGNEDDGEVGGGTPYWNTAQDLPQSLYNLLDTSSGPVFIHPVLGIPNTTVWQQIRSKFGLPSTFSFKNNTYNSSDPALQTSLISSRLVDSSEEILEDSYGRYVMEPITPATGSVIGFTMKLPSYIYGELGQVANIVGSSEVDSANVVAEGPLLVNSHDGSGGNIISTTYTSPYLLKDGQGSFLWTVNQLHHEAFTYIISRTAAEALGKTSPLAAPAYVQMRGGELTSALAYDQTTLQFQMPVSDGTSVRIRVYNYLGEKISDETVSYSAPLSRVLDKRSLLVAEPAQ